MGSNEKSSSSSKLVPCLNRSCSQQFDPDSNGPEDCKFHPGAPVFHDGLKGWSCCKRRVRDFTEFLNISGCSKGPHSADKPPMPTTANSVPEASAPLTCTTDGFEREQTSIKYIEPRLPRFEDIHRPSSDESLVPLKFIISDSLKQSLQSAGVESQEVTKIDELVKGMKCHRMGCGVIYNGDPASQEDDKCIHHPGCPVFHDGMKYYTCCQRKTSDFAEFEAQTGCNHVRGHLWQVPPTEKQCRNEFFQQGDFVTLTFYAKNPVPCECRFEVNHVRLKLALVWESGKSRLERCADLYGTINPEKSEVRFSPNKVEIHLKKLDKLVWTRLDVPPPPPPPVEH